MHLNEIMLLTNYKIAMFMCDDVKYRLGTTITAVRYAKAKLVAECIYCNTLTSRSKFENNFVCDVM